MVLGVGNVRHLRHFISPPPVGSNRGKYEVPGEVALPCARPRFDVPKAKGGVPRARHNRLACTQAFHVSQ